MENRLEELKNQRHLTQEQLGEEFGVSQQSMSNYISGKTQIPLDLLIKMADYFNVSLDYLIKRTDVRRSPEAQEAFDIEMEQYHDVVQIYKRLSAYNKGLVWNLLEYMQEHKDRKEG